MALGNNGSSAESRNSGPKSPAIRFSVRSLGWVEIAEEELTPERSSKAVNRCIVDLSLGRNDLLDVVGRWGDVRDESLISYSESTCYYYNANAYTTTPLYHYTTTFDGLSDESTCIYFAGQRFVYGSRRRLSQTDRYRELRRPQQSTHPHDSGLGSRP